ncbi:MAG: class C beta-lactamase-related serine hydrolase [Calditrichaeota bacterium]|nr:MAG: class C beta-lactamase-related serine hydrolase [Calditrichota bacterium]
MKRLLYAALLLLAFLGCSKNFADKGQPNDLWPFSSPEAQGMNGQLLSSAFSSAEAKGFVDGIVVIRNGTLVAERYYNGFDEYKPHNIMSVSKSFLSAMTGIAVDMGIISSLDEKMLDSFPEYQTADLDPLKQTITVRHLLTMRMGIRGEADDNYGVYMDFYHSSNWIEKTINAPLVSDHGEKIHYNTFQTHLLAVLLSSKAGKSAFDFATEYLCRPMNIDIDAWEKDPQGNYFGGNSMYFTPREMAMLGYLYLQKGFLGGRQILSSSWVELTLSPTSHSSHPNEWGALKNYSYGYLWWLGQINDYDLFMGYGYGGQFVVVFPDLQLIVVTTAKHQVDPDMSTVQEWALFDILSQYILPAVNIN